MHDRILEISRKHNLSHLGSNLTAVSIIDHIYKIKSHDEPFIASNGHCGLALYVVLEKYEKRDAEQLYLKHGTHPNRDEGIYCSTGSLGQGLPIALGMALADRTKNVYCLISDGESFEGTIWETANAMHRYHVTNLHIFCNWNGYSAYDTVNIDHINRLNDLFKGLNFKVIKTNVEDYGLYGLSAHYVKP